MKKPDTSKIRKILPTMEKLLSNSTQSSETVILYVSPFIENDRNEWMVCTLNEDGHIDWMRFTRNGRTFEGYLTDSGWKVAVKPNWRRRIIMLMSGLIIGLIIQYMNGWLF